MNLRILVSSPRIRSAAAALAIAGCAGCSTAAKPEFQLVWQDEFNGPAGQLPDPSRWGYDLGTDWGNAQLEYDTNRPENVSLDGDGHLAITARQEPYMGQNYTSARINTRGLFEPTYGRFEARIRLPAGQGLWPAFWLLGANIETVGWPECGEIDIMEYRGQYPNANHGTVHGPGYAGDDGVTREFELAGGRFDDDFHIFAMEWGTDDIRWMVDDSLYHRIGKADLPGRWVFDHPFYIILNVAVGGTFIGAPDSNTVFPQSMLVDWVRVYQENP